MKTYYVLETRDDYSYNPNTLQWDNEVAMGGVTAYRVVESSFDLKHDLEVIESTRPYNVGVFLLDWFGETSPFYNLGSLLDLQQDGENVVKIISRPRYAFPL